MVLVAVFAIVILLALGVYTFTDQMLTEVAVTEQYERVALVNTFAESGAEYVAAVVGQVAEEGVMTNLFDNRSLFHGVMIREAEEARGRGMFSVLATWQTDQSPGVIRYGLTDESGKLNLNAFSAWELEAEQARDSLMAIPGMTIEIADAILDWIDEDEELREFGAENEYYTALSQPYSAKNGKLESIDELMLVRGITPELMYGEDTNRNGLLDANENDGELSAPWDNGDGLLLQGWSQYLTVNSRETNLRSDGTAKIDVNQDNLAELYDAVAAEFDEQAAQFVTALRLSGGGNAGGGGGGGNQQQAANPSSNTSNAGGNQSPAGGASAGPGGGSTGGGNRAGESGANSGGAAGGTGEAGSGLVLESGVNAPGDGNRGGPTRGGLDLSRGGQARVESLYALIGSTVTATVDGQQQELESPWEDDPTSLAQDLPTLLDALTTSSEEFLEGRINIRQAPREVLMAIPDIEDTVIEVILGAQYGGIASVEADPLRSTCGWLVTDDVVDVATMRSLDRYITGTGDVYRAQILGFFGEGGPVARMEVIVDGTQRPPRILSLRDMVGLGWGYSKAQMVP